MTLKKINQFTETLTPLLLQPFQFGEINILLNYCKRAKHTKTWNVDAHYHPWFEFNYVSKGALYTTMEEKEFYISAGESFLIPPGVIHSHRHAEIGNDGICIRFSLNAPQKNSVCQTLSSPYPHGFISHIEKLHTDGGIYFLQASFAAWIMHLYDLLCEKPMVPKIAENTFAAQVNLYLQEYFREKIKINDIANALNTSPRTLSRKYHAQTGTSISAQLYTIRIRHAKQLLISTEYSLYEIANACGFENEFYFSKRFKQAEGISPSHYRKYNTPASAKKTGM